MKRRGLAIEEISSHLPFQVLLYYNAPFSVVFAVLETINVGYKMQYYEFNSSLGQLLIVPVLVLWTVAEGLRLYFGVRGNLAERVPQVAAFLLMSIFPQLPCLIFMVRKPKPRPKPNPIPKP